MIVATSASVDDAVAVVSSEATFPQPANEAVINALVRPSATKILF